MEKNDKELMFETVFNLVSESYLFINNQYENWIREKEKMKELCINSYSDEMYYDMLDQYLCLLSDLHTRIYYKPKIEFVFPIEFIWKDNELYVIGNNEWCSVPFKICKVTKINNFFVKDIIEMYKERFKEFPLRVIYSEVVANIVTKRRIFDSKDLLMKVKLEGKYQELTVKSLDIKRVFNNEKLSQRQLRQMIYEVEVKVIDNSTLYIRIKTFRDKQLKNTLIEKIKGFSDFSNVIFDLRDNDGGFINTTKEVVALFLKRDIKLDYETCYKGNDKILSEYGVIKSNIMPVMKHKNTYIFINHNTMSSAEFIFTRGLKIADPKVKIVGECSAGMSGQAKVYNLLPKVTLQVTSKKYFKNGKEIMSGIEPEYTIQNSLNNYITCEDSYLQWYEKCH